MAVPWSPFRSFPFSAIMMQNASSISLMFDPIWDDLFSVLDLDARLDWWVMAPNTYHSFFLNTICACLHASLKNYKLHMGVEHIKWLLYYRAHSLSGLDLQERSKCRATVPYSNRSFSDTKLCVDCKPMHTLLFGVQLRITTKLTYIYDCTLQFKQWLYSQQCMVL